MRKEQSRLLISSHLTHRAKGKAFTYLLVRPIVEYASTVWDGQQTKTQSTKIEAIQRRTARNVFNIPRTDHQTSTTKLLEDLDWQNLDYRRERRRLGLFRAMHFGEVATPITDYIDPHPHQNNTRRHSQPIGRASCRERV